VIKQIEELGAELDILPLADPRHLRYREIKVRLAGTVDDAHTRIPEVGAIANDW